jgi:hypothetical protein
MVIVVQLLATNQHAPRHDVGRRGGQFETSIPDAVAEPVDDATGEEGLSHQLHGEHGDGRHAEQNQLQDHK